MSYQDNSFALPLNSEKGSLTAILADRTHGGENLKIIAPPGEYRDLWTDETVIVPHTGEITPAAKDGIVLLWRSVVN